MYFDEERHDSRSRQPQHAAHESEYITSRGGRGYIQSVTRESSPSAGRRLEPLDTELIAPSLEARARDAAELQIVEGFLQWHRLYQGRQFAIERSFIATLD